MRTRTPNAGIRDVAREAGVSVSTVSHVVNRTRYVEPATADRVNAAIVKLGYQPNSIARSLRHGRTHTIGLLVPDNANPFFAEIARVIEDEGFKAGYSVILCNSDGQAIKEKTYVDVLLSKKVDGLLLIASSKDLAGLDRILRDKVPVVAVDRGLDQSSISQILVDNWRGGCIAGDYLVGLGHREIAYIAGPNETTPSAQRLRGLRDVLADAGLTLPDERIVVGDFRFTGGSVGIQTLLARGVAFSAVFAANDLMAIGAISALHAAGRRVPDDVSVIGFDDIPLAGITTPPLTTIAQPIAEIGTQCIRILLEQIRDPGSGPQRVILNPALMPRASCRSIADE